MSNLQKIENSTNNVRFSVLTECLAFKNNVVYYFVLHKSCRFFHILLPSSTQAPASAGLSLALFSLFPQYVAEAPVYVAEAPGYVAEAPPDK